jgi:hypothetical protein
MASRTDSTEWPLDIPAASAVVLMALSTPLIAGAQMQVLQGGVTFAALRPGNVVERIDPLTGAPRGIYTSRKWSIMHLTVSPSGAYLALVEVEQGTVTGTQYSTLPATELIVLDSAGTVVGSIAKGVQKYGWCGTSCIAYILGEASETDLGFIPRAGLHLYDLTTRVDRNVGDELYPIDLEWAPFDTSVYVKTSRPVAGSRIFKVHVGTGSVAPTTFRDLHFSLDGSYYLHYPDPADPVLRVFESRSNQEVTLTNTVDFLPVTWVPSGATHLLLRRRVPVRMPRSDSVGGPLAVTGAEGDVEHVIYDVRAKRTFRVLRGHVPKWSSRPGMMPFISGGRPNAIVRQP